MLLGWGPCSGRPLEDPGLVGEESARRAREERVRREREEALAMENRRWDWYLCKSSPPLPFTFLCPFPLPLPRIPWPISHIPRGTLAQGTFEDEADSQLAAQMNNWPERQRRWPTFARQHMGIEERKSFMRRISGRVFG